MDLNDALLFRTNMNMLKETCAVRMGGINKKNMHPQLCLLILLIQKYATSSETATLLKPLYGHYNTACHQPNR